MTPTLAFAALIKVAVLNLTASGVDQALVDNLSEVILVETQALGAYQVIGKSDIQGILGFEAQRQLTGCDAESASCIAELGGALGVDFLITGSVGKLDDVFLVNLKLVDMKTTTVRARKSDEVEGKSSKLIASVRKLVPQLFAPVSTPKATITDAGPTTKPPPTTPPAVTAAVAGADAQKPEAPATPGESTALGAALRWGGTAVGVLGLLAGTATGIKSERVYEDYQKAIVPADIAALRADSESAQTGSRIFLTLAGVGIAAAIAGFTAVE